MTRTAALVLYLVAASSTAATAILFYLAAIKGLS